MNALLAAYLRLCLLRIPPQELPASRFLLQMAAVALLISGVLALSVSDGVTPQVVLAVLLDMLLTYGLLQLGLRLVRKPRRLTQALSATFGCSALIQLVSIPLALLIGGDPGEDLVSQLAVALYLLLVVWSLAVMAHILRHTLDLPFWGGLMIAVGYWLLINDLLVMLHLH